mgnify:CR=1 FL=1
MKNLENENTEPKIRQLIVDTDGSQIWIKKAEVSKIELVAICNMIISYVSKPEPETPLIKDHEKK